MALNDDQKKRLSEVAAREGVDLKALEMVADNLLAQSSQDGPKLFMYLLPFVRVREVRNKWLGLTEPFPGDEQVASDWAMEHGGSNAPEEAPPEG